MKNIFDLHTPQVDEETILTFLKKNGVEIKGIMSNTLSTKREFTSDKDEWVVLLQGCAKIEMQNTIYKLKKGDTIFIPANTKHTLIKTKKTAFWLSVYL